MKYKGFESYKNFTWFFIIPTIVIYKDDDDVVYMSKNLSIQLHWLGIHCRWLWVEKDE